MPGSHRGGETRADIIALSGSEDATLWSIASAYGTDSYPCPWLVFSRSLKKFARRSLDFVIDLHSLSETNLLGFIPGHPTVCFRAGPDAHLITLPTSNPATCRNRSSQTSLDDRISTSGPLASQVPSDCLNSKFDSPTRPELERILVKAKADAGAPWSDFSLALVTRVVVGHWNNCQPRRFLIRNDRVKVLVFVGLRSVLYQGDRQHSGWRCLDQLSIAQTCRGQARLTACLK